MFNDKKENKAFSSNYLIPRECISYEKELGATDKSIVIYVIMKTTGLGVFSRRGEVSAFCFERRNLSGTLDKYSEKPLKAFFILYNICVMKKIFIINE